MGLSESREQAVRTELKQLLQSDTFRTSKRCREFLAYIVEHTLGGPSGTLKERSIGTELFQLPQGYDTGQHTIVRVTATEVRKKLAQHYLAQNGSYHAVKIELPPGSYIAEFRWEAPVADTRVRRDRAWLISPWAIALTTAVLVTGVVFALWRWRAMTPASGGAKPLRVSSSFVKVGAGSGDVRMIVGSSTPYIDRSGRTWAPDRFFSGGTVIVRPSERIFRTLDPDVYRHLRRGDFRYDIPLAPGYYELHLHFAETGLADFISAESSGEGQRLFAVSINDKRVLDLFDVVADAFGADVSDERVFRDISPADDGFLHINLTSQRGTAMLSGIELLPVSPGKVRPIRIRAGWTSSWRDSAGQQWQADSYFQGGNALVRGTNPVRENNAVPDMALYASERWGHFSYAVPVADGRYKVTLKFCEGHYGRQNVGVGGIGSRVFDVYCNGTALLRDFDIDKEAGGEGRPLDRTFSGIRPTAQGKIVLTFVPIKGMACVNGIEVTE